MKKFVLLAIASVFSLAVSAQAVLKLDRTTHNFGTFKESKVQKTTFTVTNAGDKPLVLQQVFTSCNCTVADYTKTAIEPGKTGFVTVTYDGRNKFLGHFRKTVTLRSNASNSIVRINIEGTIEKD